MKAVKRRDTSPEVALKQALRKAKIIYRSGHGKHKPNSADVLLPHLRYAIFVNGCFWHGHKGCHKATVPATRRDYWLNKISKNINRDERAMRAFSARGWKPLAVWECEIKQPLQLTRIIANLSANKGS
jgi:DNA mismatch endonuclease (patch repair protein)